MFPGAERPPEGWPGWPEGKRFAFVLTHDVEGPEGVAKIPQLMELESDLGFRSCFNLIPEGDYRVTRELRELLTAKGFEVGVHDLHHDGKLYSSREEFDQKAERINAYLKEWGAVGFRSGFMLRNLDWLKELNVLYEMSTFDTDPFEPQPDGAGTIFPYFVARNGAAVRAGGEWSDGYVELPYTLPQDSTLYLVFRERVPDIWLQKLDWVAKHGGMALVNVHPDHVRFNGENPSSYTFSAELYADLLKYVRQRYGDACWYALPKELAEWYRTTLPRVAEAAAKKEVNHSPNGQSCFKGKRAAVVLYSAYPSDARPRRELQALLDEGMSVDLFCLQEDSKEPLMEQFGALRVTRLKLRHYRGGKLRYLLQYAVFWLWAFGRLSARSLRCRYDLVHVHNMPDVLVFTAILPKCRGAKVILDLHDPMPELYETIYGLKPDSLMIRCLKVLERRSIHFAHLVLTPNEAFRQLFAGRSCADGKVKIVMNTPDEAIFHSEGLKVRPSKSSGTTGEFHIMYHGLFARRHGLETLVRAVAQASETIPNVVLDLYGRRNAYFDEIERLAAKLELKDRFRYHGKWPLDKIPEAISQADLGIIPNSRTSFTEINFPTRIFEYLCMNVPVIAPDTQGIRDYFDSTKILFFAPDDVDSLVTRIRWVHDNPQQAQEILARGRMVYNQYRWQTQRVEFLVQIASLLGLKAA